MHFITVVGVIAAFCSMASFVPQAWKIIRTRETGDISAGMFSLTVSAFAFWCVYGALLREWPLIVSNGVCLALSSFILMMTLLPRHKKEVVAEAIETPVAAMAEAAGTGTTGKKGLR
jgi:MtN3 and saliva related transmembrane protein